MKSFLSSIFIILALSVSSFGQSPQQFNYQAVVRDAGNIALQNQSVGMRMSIIQGSVSGTVVYTETFATTTNSFGLVNLAIGTGATTGDIASVDWENGPYFIETAVDVAGGSSYSVMGTSQLLSVPYALYAAKANSVTNDLVNDADADPSNELQSISRTGNTVTLSDNGGTFEDSVGVYTAGAGITIENNVVSLADSCGLAIGDSAFGGIIFYLDASGCHGIVCASTDQSAGIQWRNSSSIDTYAYGSGLAAGLGNTSAIMRWQGAGSFATSTCYNQTISGTNDWYLPSVYELKLMYSNVGPGNSLGLGNVAGFSSGTYWSSTEHSWVVAWFVNFNDGSSNGDTKTVLYRTRAARLF